MNVNATVSKIETPLSVTIQFHPLLLKTQSTSYFVNEDIIIRTPSIQRTILYNNKLLHNDNDDSTDQRPASLRSNPSPRFASHHLDEVAANFMIITRNLSGQSGSVWEIYFPAGGRFIDIENGRRPRQGSAINFESLPRKRRERAPEPQSIKPFYLRARNPPPKQIPRPAAFPLPQPPSAAVLAISSWKTEFRARPRPTGFPRRSRLSSGSSADSA